MHAQRRADGQIDWFIRDENLAVEDGREWWLSYRKYTFWRPKKEFVCGGRMQGAGQAIE